jgi:hypothetical protein
VNCGQSLLFIVNNLQNYPNLDEFLRSLWCIIKVNDRYYKSCLPSRFHKA